MLYQQKLKFHCEGCVWCRVISLEKWVYGDVDFQVDCKSKSQPREVSRMAELVLLSPWFAKTNI